MSDTDITVSRPPVEAPLGGGEAIHPVGAPPSRSTARRIWSGLGPPILFGLIALGAWYFISYVLLDQAPRQNGFLLRPPHRVIDEAFLNGEILSEMMRGLWSTTKVAMIGLFISIVLGFGLATIMSQSKFFERGVFPYMVILQAMPILAIVPLIGFWFGTGEPIWDVPVIGFVNSRVVVCVIISLFPIIVNTLFGLQSAERGMHDLFTLHHASRATRLRKLMFPAAMPAIFAGLRISAGLSVIGAIVGDFFFGRGGSLGIGQLLRQYTAQAQGEASIAAMIVSSALGVAVFLAFGRLQTAVIGKWHDTDD